MDYSINGYLNRMSVEQLEKILQFCNENYDQYKNIIEDICKIIGEKKNQ